MSDLNLSRRTIFSSLELFLIAGFAIVPLFVAFPYRVNIFLSWEGAYRLSQGQVPYRDFGMPLGYMFWVVPALFMKLFGAQMLTLVKAQVFLNIISGFAFRSVLKSIGVQPGIRLLSVLLYCLSFSFFNFWPWYNHTVIVYEMIALAFLLRYIFIPLQKYNWIWLALSALAAFCSFFTKQDGGGMAILLCLVLLLSHCLYEKKWQPLLIYIGSLFLIGTLFIYPLTKYNFSYWFNHGQPPHSSRVDPYEIIAEFLSASEWLKFYFFLVLLLAAAQFRTWKTFFTDKAFFFFLLLTLGILAQASILQVTSYTPPDNNIYFHSFAIAFILSGFATYLKFNFYQLRPLLLCGAGLMLWWSGTYWRYFQKIARRAMSATAQTTTTSENVVNRNTYKLNFDTSDIPLSEWRFSSLPSLHKIYLPGPTVDGIDRLMQMDLIKSGKPLRVLNMTELTSLAVEIPYEPERGLDQPLWYHLGVAMFNKEAELFENRIRNKQYDLVLFEYVPVLNNFYPFRVRDVLKKQYQLKDSFMAPRRNDTKGMIEVYTPK
ncbi:MAG TPA: hypothetical protein VM010_05640 [Chitinophagaceae bacterium]|nr:hypothetical protein [Chitinophagaceae bacterium]